MPPIRLYRLKRGKTFYADTRRPDGSRWQFSTGEVDEAPARDVAQAKVSAVFGDGSVTSGARDETPASAGLSPEVSKLADKIRAAGERVKAAPADAGAADAAGTAPPGDAPTPEGEMLADVIAMAAVLGWSGAVANAIRRRRWKESGRTGHYEPAPASQPFVEGLQRKLRERAIALVGHVGVDGWMGVGIMAGGVAVSMAWNAERVTDDGRKVDEQTSAPPETNGTQAQATQPAPPPSGAIPTPGHGAPQAGVAVADLTIFKPRAAS